MLHTPLARKINTVETSDIYYAGYLMSRGCELCEVKRKGSGKRQFIFLFAGENLSPLAYEYLSGRAEVNVKYLKSSIEHLKGIIPQLNI